MSLLFYTVTSSSLDLLMVPVFSQGNRFYNETALSFLFVCLFYQTAIIVKPVDLSVKLALQNVTGVYSVWEWSLGYFSTAKGETPSPQPTAGWDEGTCLLVL